MNIRSIQYLVAVADYRHFGRAAKACHVSQPTLSAQLKKLEEYLGVQVFERNCKLVEPTELGREIIELARVILAGIEEMKMVGRRASEREKARLEATG